MKPAHAHIRSASKATVKINVRCSVLDSLDSWFDINPNLTLAAILQVHLLL